MKITWIGHSCFKIEASGTTIILDPYAPDKVPGLKPIEETAQLVLCSHGHGDHGYKEAVKIVPMDSSLPDGSLPLVTEFASWHDDAQGTLRGANTIHLITATENATANETNIGDTTALNTATTIKIAHLGDLGCVPSAEATAALSGVDVMMIPVGGHFTIDGRQAAALVKELQPKLVIPMHYRDDEKHIGFPVISTVDGFLGAMGGAAEIITVGSTMDPVAMLKEHKGTTICMMAPEKWQ